MATGAVLAAHAPHVGAAPPIVPSADTATDPDDPGARFDRAEILFREGRYDEAITVLQALLREYPEPILHYNLGRAQESSGRIEEAIVAYELYLDGAPDAPDRETVLARVQRLRTRVQRDAAAAIVPEPRPQPAPPLSESPPIVLPWVMTGVGGAGLIVGAAFGGLSRQRIDEARSETEQVAASDALSDARSNALLANVMFAVGGSLATAGLTWGIIAVTRKRKRAVAWSPSPGGLTLRF
ncbi:MAG: tetratricopeptide repeat protein [Nannocystaceae bacterium]|nr:tetratricopeptide repeat protein [Nannocystaceae bacterium]